ncbi:MAG: glycogen synthase [Myxococcota bacterium]|nr:glycogen synthase [Myxococcota bacterium]
MKVLSVTAELSPYCKTGGLGDVAAAFPDAFAQCSADFEFTRLVPFYRDAKNNLLRSGKGVHLLPVAGRLELAGRTWNLGFWQLSDSRDVRTVFVSAEGLFDTEGLYGSVNIGGVEYGEEVRFAVLNLAALTFGNELVQTKVDIFHVHDWHAGLLPWLRKREGFAAHRQTPVVMTIHNLAYQGWFEAGCLPEVATKEEGPLHFLKLGIEHSDVVTTVSPQYAREIQTPEFGYGLEGILKEKGVTGILNGVELDAWDPQKDTFIKHHFSAANLSPKQSCKESLLSACGLDDASKPLLGVVARFDYQKGLDLLAQTIPLLSEQGCNLVILGSGSADLEETYRELQIRYSEFVYTHIGFDNALAHQIFAGCDMILVPSRFEPCGLTQLYAMRYGGLPVVTPVGGLLDTVVEVAVSDSPPQGSGFVAKSVDAQAFLQAMVRGIHLFRSNPNEWKQVQMQVMQSDFSWEKSIPEYIRCYNALFQS